MKDSYVSYVLEEYLADGNFDATFGEGWIDDAQFDALIPTTCNNAFAEYAIDADGKYSDVVALIFKDMLANSAIAHQGDEYAGNWYKLRPTAKTKYINERRAKNPAASRIGSLGEQALQRALTKIVAEDELRSLEESQAEADQSNGQPTEDILVDTLETVPNPNFFKSEERKLSFGYAVEKAIVEVEGSTLSNSDKAQAHGYLTAARALSETPDPPVDLIWSVLNRANNLAGIGSFFLGLITLIAMVTT